MVRVLAQRIGFLSRPVENRFGKRTVPLGGGIAIFGAMTIIIIAAVLSVKFLLVPGRLGWIVKAANIEPSDFLGKIGQLAVILLAALVLILALGR